MTNTNIRRYNYFERDLLEHVMIGYLDYMSMTTRESEWKPSLAKKKRSLTLSSQVSCINSLTSPTVLL